MKRFLSLVLALALCLCAAGCSPRGRKNSATRIINSDLNAVTDLADGVLSTGKVPEDAFIKGVESIDYAAPDWVAFITGSREEDGGSAVCGFYYSPEDKPMGYRGEDMELAADGSGYSWQGSQGGLEAEKDSYYTERCQAKWFYFEVYL